MLLHRVPVRIKDCLSQGDALSGPVILSHFARGNTLNVVLGKPLLEYGLGFCLCRVPVCRGGPDRVPSPRHPLKKRYFHSVSTSVGTGGSSVLGLSPREPSALPRWRCWVCESKSRGCFPSNAVISGTAAFSVIAVETVLLGGSSRKCCKFF